MRSYCNLATSPTLSFERLPLPQLNTFRMVSNNFSTLHNGSKIPLKRSSVAICDWDVIGALGDWDVIGTSATSAEVCVWVWVGQVDGWGDPRMPTVQGLFRRGMQLQALSSFMESQGASKNTNLMVSDPSPARPINTRSVCAL